MSKAGEVVVVMAFFAGLWAWVKMRANRGYTLSDNEYYPPANYNPAAQVNDFDWSNPFGLGFADPAGALGASSFFEPAKPIGAQPMDSEVEWLARTIWGEARGEGASGMAAVANVIMNRVKSRRFPNTVQGVVLQPHQFSMWNAGEPNGDKARAVTVDDPAFAKAVEIARVAVAGQLGDTTGGALHYYATWLTPPAWAKSADASVTIGRHVFLTGVA